MKNLGYQLLFLNMWCVYITLYELIKYLETFPRKLSLYVARNVKGTFTCQAVKFVFVGSERMYV